MSYNKDQAKKHAKRALSVGFGVAQLVSDQVGSVVSGLERDGHINRAEGKKMAKKLLAEANKFQRKISSRVDKQVRKVVKSSSSKKSAQKRGAKKKKQQHLSYKLLVYLVEMWIKNVGICH